MFDIAHSLAGDGGISEMQDARYFRTQAMLCLQAAASISDRTAREKLEAEATRYVEQAEALEEGTVPPLKL